MKKESTVDGRQSTVGKEKDLSSDTVDRRPSTVDPSKLLTTLSSELLEQIIAETYSAYHLLVNLGFLGRDVVVLIAPRLTTLTPQLAAGTEYRVFVQLRYPGHEPFSVVTSPAIDRCLHEAVNGAWRKFLTDEKPNRSDAELDRFIEKTYAKIHQTEFVYELASRGLLAHFDQQVTGTVGKA